MDWVPTKPSNYMVFSQIIECLKCSVFFLKTEHFKHSTFNKNRSFNMNINSQILVELRTYENNFQTK